MLGAKSVPRTGNDIDFDEELADRALRQLVRMNLTVRELDHMTGGLSRPSKMPGLSFNLPALLTCRVGSILNKIKGSVCSSCYALKGRYVFPECKAAMLRRLDRMQQNPHVWAAALTLRIRRYKTDRRLFFRWHDSGDITGQGHYSALKWVAKQTPDTKHWIPTRERQVVESSAPPPTNMVARVSMARVGQRPPQNRRDLLFSSVGTDDPEAFRCGAPDRGGKCGPCRACWDPAVWWVDYVLH